MKIERLGKDSLGEDVSEGYYAVAPGVAGVVLMPPRAEMAKGLRLATQAEVDVGPAQPAWVEHIADGTVEHEAAAKKLAIGAGLAADAAVTLGAPKAR